jgi:hypothetical protein
VPVPPPIASFLDAHAADPQPWRITFREDHAKRTVTLAADVSEEIVARLAEAGTNQDGDIGCVSDDPLHIELQRGDASLSLVFDCGHLYLTPQGHAGPFVILASDFIERIEALRTSSFRARGIH